MLTRIQKSEAEEEEEDNGRNARTSSWHSTDQATGLTLLAARRQVGQPSAPDDFQLLRSERSVRQALDYLAPSPPRAIITITPIWLVPGRPKEWSRGSQLA